MEEPIINSETLHTIAQVAISLIGFSGIVVMFGDRHKRKWTGHEAVQFFAIIATPMTALVGSFTPILMYTLTTDHETIWRTSNAVLGILHFANVIYFNIRSRNEQVKFNIAQYFLLITGVSVLLGHLLTTLNFIKAYEFAFLIGLLQQLLMGIYSFIALFQPAFNKDDE